MAIPSSGTIQEIAFKLAEAKLVEQQLRDDLHAETTIFVLGSQNVGKTTIINKFLDKEPTQPTRPTLALEYSFARRTTSSHSNQHPHPQQTTRPVCHVWELGGSGSAHNPDDSLQLAQHNLCDIPLRSADHGLRQMRIVIVLDLSQPDRIWSDLTQALQRLDVAFRKATDSSSPGEGGAAEYESIRAQRWQEQQQMLSQSDDLDGDETGGVGGEMSTVPMPPQYFPVPLLLVGGKYDVFKNFDPEIKKHICRALRSVALLLGATSLLFVSTHSPPQMAAIRATLNQFAFRPNAGHHSPNGNTATSSNRHRHRRSANQQATVVDHNEALSIAAGADSWTLIGHMPKQAVAEVGVMLSAHIPQRTATAASSSAEEPDPARDPNFRESAVDEMRAQLDAALLERWRDMEVRQNFHSMSSMAESSSGF